jgi:hypothetical protein
VHLFRTLFHRCYELAPEKFVAAGSEISQKAKSLSEVLAVDIPIPWRLMDSNADRRLTIRELFRSDPGFQKAADILSLSAFDSNPLDVLYRVHTCLTQIRAAAGDRRPAARGDGFLALDDMFSLFLGVFLAADVPDMATLFRMATEYAPTSGLSAPFECAQANMAALRAHVNDASVDQLQGS